MPPIPNAPKLNCWLPAAAEYFAPPDETQPFDPTAAWDHCYVVLNSGLLRPGGRVQAEGFVRVSRRPKTDGPDDQFILNVKQLAAKQRFGSYSSTFQIHCRGDGLSSPTAWRTTSHSLDIQNRPVPLTRIQQEGSLGDGLLTITGAKTRQTPLAGAVSSNWSLFDAVQRLGGGPIEPMDFTLLEDLDLVKPNQRLSYWGTIDLPLGDSSIRLVGYQQIGQGILPYHYWLDTSGRLLFAYSGLRAFLFNPQAESLKEPQRQPASRPANQPGRTPR